MNASSPSPRDLLDAALEISAAAEKIPLRYFRADIAVEDKADASPVTVADRETEDAIRREIQARFPGHAILGEEFGGEKADTGIDLVAARHCQRAARAEIVLDVDHDECRIVTGSHDLLARLAQHRGRA